MPASVQFRSKSPFPLVAAGDYSLWQYEVLLEVADPESQIGIGFSGVLDIKDPSLFATVLNLQGTRLDKPEGGTNQFVVVTPAVAHPKRVDISFVAPTAEDAFTPVSLLSVDSDGVQHPLTFQAGPATVESTVQVMRGPSAASAKADVPGAPVVKTGILPYASELFGVYQPLLGWRSALAHSRLADATARRFTAATRLIADSEATRAGQPFGTLLTPTAMNRTGTQVGKDLAVHITQNPGTGGGPAAWDSLLRREPTSVLSSITHNVIAGLQKFARATVAPRDFGSTAAGASQGDPSLTPAQTQVANEAATATLLHYLGQTAPAVVTQMFHPAAAAWQRAIAGAVLFADPSPARSAFLSPIGILHSFREYFFELGTFLGPPVGHVWISPGGTVELVEVNTRRVLVERTVDQSTETVQKSETSQTDKDELSDAVKTENADDIKLGVTATASGGVSGVWQASGTASFSLDSSRKQAQEQTHKRMREQSSKLSSEVRQNYKTTFRTVTETTDTSSRRYVIQNTTARLVSYELSRKMRKVAVQVQDLGQQLCWQLYIDNPGTPLGLGEFVHNASTALDPGVKQPDKLPYPQPQEKPFSSTVPFILYQGADDGASDTYARSGDNADHGIFSPGAGSDDIIQFRFDFIAPAAAEGYVLSRIRTIDFHGAQVEYTIDGLGTNPDPVTGKFSFCLTHANFGGAHALPFDAILVYEVTQGARDQVDAQNAAAKKTYDDDVAIKREEKFYETLRLRLKLTGQVKSRPEDDLREEERNMVYRSIITRLYGSEKSWSNEDFHVASEIIRYLFDVDAMLYFVAPDWWRPRAQALVSKNNQNEIQPTVIADSALTNKLGIGRYPVLGTYRPNYLITEETTPAPLGSSLGWLIQLDGDMHRNAFLNSPWVKAVLPLRPGREREAIAWLRRVEVAGTDGLNEQYPFDAAQDPAEYNGLTIEQVLLKVADRIAEEYKLSLTPVPVDPGAVNPELTLPTETVYSHGFDPLEGGIKFGSDAFKIFSQWIEVLPTDQVVATEYSLAGL